MCCFAIRLPQQLSLWLRWCLFEINHLKRLSFVHPVGAFVLGGLNPDLYRLEDEEDDLDFPDDHIGRIWLAVEYEMESERLVVSLIKAKNLPSRVRGSVNQCDPLVKVFLLPEERRHLQSKVKRKTTNPKFDESFVFQVNCYYNYCLFKLMKLSTKLKYCFLFKQTRSLI